MRKFWPFMVNFFNYGAFAMVVPLFVLYYQDLGFTGTQIGLLAGLPPIITIFSAPFWTNLADRTGRYRRVWGGLLFMGIVILLFFPVFKTFAFVLILLISFNLVISPNVSFIDTSTMHMLGEEKDMYGRVRLGGTFGFGIFAVVSGSLVEQVGIDYAFYGAAVLFVMAFFFSRKLEFGQPQPENPAEAEIRVTSLFKEARWLALFVLAMASGIGFSASAVYFYPYMEGLGARESLMGAAVFVGTMMEIPILYYSSKFMKIFKPYSLLVMATLITGLRLVAFGLNTETSLVFVIQLFNGLTFGLLWIAGVAYADENAPKNMKATVQGLFGAMNFGVGPAIGGFIGGFLLERIGGNGLFLYFGLAIVIITGIVVVAVRRNSTSEQASIFP